MKERIHTSVDEIFSAVQKLTEASLCLAAVGACYGLNQLFYYWPIVQANG